MNAARIVTRYSAFLLAGSVGLLVFLLPLLRPAALWRAEFSIDPVSTSSSVALVSLIIGLLAWVYREMRAPAIVSALAKAGQVSSRPTGYFLLGAAIPLLISTVVFTTLHGDTGAKAVGLAKARYGDTYSYNPISFSKGGNNTSVTLDAYNNSEIKSVTVSWSE